MAFLLLEDGVWLVWFGWVPRVILEVFGIRVSCHIHRYLVRLNDCMNMKEQ